MIIIIYYLSRAEQCVTDPRVILALTMAVTRCCILNKHTSYCLFFQYKYQLRRKAKKPLSILDNTSLKILLGTSRFQVLFWVGLVISVWQGLVLISPPLRQKCSCVEIMGMGISLLGGSRYYLATR